MAQPQPPPDRPESPDTTVTSPVEPSVHIGSEMPAPDTTGPVPVEERAGDIPVFPVFFDPTGRRHLWSVLTGVLAVVISAAVLTAVLFVLLSPSTAAYPAPIGTTPTPRSGTTP